MKNSLLLTTIVIIVILGAGLVAVSKNNDKPEKEGLPPPATRLCQNIM